ncbi:MAG: hypothetical protein IKV53_01820 [Clostridia bacterium]|nr:hypothetical protein [Clostridia bacterium]
MSVWYIDSSAQSGDLSGRDENNPRLSYVGLKLSAGDRVLLKRGTAYRDAIVSESGSVDYPILWCTWGEG